MRILGTNIKFIDAMIIANVFVFILDMASSGIEDMCGQYINWVSCTFALIPSLVLEEPWRLVTNMFLHSGFGHLFVNMLALYFFGAYVLQIIDEKDLIKIYFAGGLGGAMLYTGLAFLGIGGLNTLVVGASGAIFGVGGALAVLRPDMKVMIFPIPIPLSMWAAQVIIFFFTAFIPHVAWQGHLGGLLAGALLGLHYKNKKPPGHEQVYFVTRQY